MPDDQNSITAGERRPVTQDDDNYSQAGALYRLMSEGQKNQLARNVAAGLSHATREVQEIMLGYFRAADADYGARVPKAML